MALLPSRCKLHFERAQSGVIAVIKREFERRPSRADTRRSPTAGGLQQPSDLRRHDKLTPIDPTKARSQSKLGEPESVQRRGIEITQSRRVHRSERTLHRLVTVTRFEASERRGADAEQRD